VLLVSSATARLWLSIITCTLRLCPIFRLLTSYRAAIYCVHAYVFVRRISVKSRHSHQRSALRWRTENERRPTTVVKNVFRCRTNSHGGCDIAKQLL